MEKPKISACLVIKPEEAVLKRCLESLKGVANEIILVHDGPPKDRSLEIAKEFGARIFIRDFVGEAEFHRPLAFEQATGDWILHIDADEFLSSGAREQIPQLVTDLNIDAYSFWWPIFYEGQYLKSGHFSKLYKGCLFRKSKMYMVGLVHEFPRTYGKLQLVPCQLEHQPPHSNLDKDVIKKKWPKIQAKQTLQLESLPTFNIFDQTTNTVIKQLRFRRRFPVLALFWDVTRAVLVDLRDGVLWSGVVSLKIAWVELVNLFWYYYYIAQPDFS